MKEIEIIKLKEIKGKNMRFNEIIDKRILIQIQKDENFYIELNRLSKLIYIENKIVLYGIEPINENGKFKKDKKIKIVYILILLLYFIFLKEKKLRMILKKKN